MCSYSLQSIHVINGVVVMQSGCGCCVCQIGLNLLVAEARLEAELIYALYAINRNMNMAF